MNGRNVSSPEPAAALASRLAGGIWGHLVGDAVGVPYEFREASEIGEVRFGATGSHGQPPGTWSDDGALMLALLDSLLTAGFDVEDQGRRAVAWYRDGAYTPDGDGRFDVGLTTTAALSAIERGTPAADAGPTGEFDNGNGSLMRILPIALVERDAGDATLVDHAQRASRVTHGHPRAQVACALYVLVAARLLAGERDRAQALADARASLRNVLADQPDHLAALDHLEAYKERGGRGSVWDSFWSAWDAFEGAESYRETIERAVSYGNDTDTTAAIAGGLAGIYWGLDGIPEEWLAGMRGREVVEPLVANLTKSLDRIRVDPVDLSEVPRLAGLKGRLGMTFTPGKRDEVLSSRPRRGCPLAAPGLWSRLVRPAHRGPRARPAPCARSPEGDGKRRHRASPLSHRRRQHPRLTPTRSAPCWTGCASDSSMASTSSSPAAAGSVAPAPWWRASSSKAASTPRPRSRTRGAHAPAPSKPRARRTSFAPGCDTSAKSCREPSVPAGLALDLGDPGARDPEDLADIPCR